MLLFLIRHAESEHNVAGLLAGVTDSRLTAHGALQTHRLGRYLVQQRKLTFTHIFSSDLTRAILTADAILDAQINVKYTENARPERIVLEILREQDFGSLECQPWASKPNPKGANGKAIDPSHPGFKPKETTEAIARRMDTFLNEMIHPIQAAESDSESVVAVVSHGITLSVLWKALLQRFGAQSVSLGPEVIHSNGNRPLDYLPTWSNTGYLEVDIKPAPLQHGLGAHQSERQALLQPIPGGHTMVIRTVNGKDHINSLKRTRGGLGSTAFDAKQKSIDGFFKKPKVEEQNTKAD